MPNAIRDTAIISSVRLRLVSAWLVLFLSVVVFPAHLASHAYSATEALSYSAHDGSDLDLRHDSCLLCRVHGSSALDFSSFSVRLVVADYLGNGAVATAQQSRSLVGLISSASPRAPPRSVVS